jgi:hypothetical protein
MISPDALGRAARKAGIWPGAAFLRRARSLVPRVQRVRNELAKRHQHVLRFRNEYSRTLRETAEGRDKFDGRKTADDQGRVRGEAPAVKSMAPPHGGSPSKVFRRWSPEQTAWLPASKREDLGDDHLAVFVLDLLPTLVLDDARLRPSAAT